MQNRIQELFKRKNDIVSVYFTAGYPQINDTLNIIKELENSGVDMIEIGLPFSDPLADGPVIQASSTQALRNGMTTELLFQQLQEVRKAVNIPLLIMGYFNPIFQYGVDEFCAKCQEIGIDGLIIPDLPLEVYSNDYKNIFEKNNLLNVLLITPQTKESRIRLIDQQSNGFIYMVSSSSVTGGVSAFSEEQILYFKRIKDMDLQNPTVVGFGVNSNAHYEQATKFSDGVIIGSAFIKLLYREGIAGIKSFVTKIKEGSN